MSEVIALCIIAAIVVASLALGPKKGDE